MFRCESGYSREHAQSITCEPAEVERCCTQRACVCAHEGDQLYKGALDNRSVVFYYLPYALRVRHDGAKMLLSNGRCIRSSD
jgi:hypothetical protein